MEETVIQISGGKRNYIWNPSTCICEYLASIMDDSAIICDEIIKETAPTNSNENEATCKTQNFYILLAFLVITTALLIAVSIYRYLIKHRAKQKHLLPFQNTNNELKHPLPFHDTNNELKQYKLKMSNKVKIWI